MVSHAQQAIAADASPPDQHGPVALAAASSQPRLGSTPRRGITFYQGSRARDPRPPGFWGASKITDPVAHANWMASGKASDCEVPTRSSPDKLPCFPRR
jgi:hypothetical protein